MRIVFITNNYTPYSGGVVSSINASVDALRKAGHEVFIITLDFLGVVHDDPPYVLRIPCLFKFTYNQNPLAIPWRPYHHMMRMIRALKPDIIHTHHPFYLGSIALKIAQKLSLPIVFTYHTIYEGYAHYVPLPQWLTRYAATKKVMRFCRDVDGIIAPSNFICQQVQSHVIQTPIVVIPSGLQELFLLPGPFVLSLSKHKWDLSFDPAFVKTSAGTAGQGHSPTKPWRRRIRTNGNVQLSTQIFQLLYVGRFTQEKNIPFILDVMQMLQQNSPRYTSPAHAKHADERIALRAHNKFQLKLVGYGIEYDNLRAYAYHTLNLSEDVVQFIHKPPKQELLGHYRQADLFLFPSYTDTQGLVLAEAMACGVPVLAIHGPGQQDIVHNGYNGFLVAERRDMAEKIVAIAQDQALHTLLRQGAFETSKKYHPQRVTESLMSFYRDVLDKNVEYR